VINRNVFCKWGPWPKCRTSTACLSTLQNLAGSSTSLRGCSGGTGSGASVTVIIGSGRNEAGGSTAMQYGLSIQPASRMGSFCVTRPNPTHQVTDPFLPNPLQVEKLGPNSTQPNATNNGAYSLVVTCFYTQNLSVSGTCQIGRKIKFNCLVQPNLI